VSQLGVIRGLWSLVVNDDDNKDTACREGAIEAIVGAMQTHPASSDLQGAACMVMWYVQYSTVQYPAAAHLSISRLLSSPLFSIFCLLFWASSGAVLIHHSAQHMHGVEPADIPPALLARMMLI
jgi:hypothetical protein